MRLQLPIMRLHPPISALIADIDGLPAGSDPGFRIRDPRPSRPLPCGRLAQSVIDVVTLGFCLLFSMVAAVAIVAAPVILLFVRW